jgi:hypothetical protein
VAQRDYILRLIEQAAGALRRALDLILGRKGSPGEVAEQLRAALGITGLDPGMVRVLDAEALVLLIAPTGEAEPGRCWLVAETLYLDGLEAQLDDRPDEARASLAKARLLFRLLEPDAVLPSGFPEASARLREIEDRIRVLEG